MLLTSIQACIVATAGELFDKATDITVVSAGPANGVQQVASLLEQDNGLLVQETDHLTEGSRRALFVTRARTALVVTAKQIVTLPAGSVRHLDLRALDCSPEDLFRCESLSNLQSLEASRLDLDDDSVMALADSEVLAGLAWLDLAGNPGVSEVGVEAIAEAVHQQRLPNLEWVELIGTSCDSTPYVDGSYWRMTDHAIALAAEFGYQNWMMLGSKDPEMANREILPKKSRSAPPDRFSSA